MSEPNRQEEPPAEPEPAPHTSRRVVRVWLIGRTGLQLVELLAVKHEGLHLAVQALVTVGDLVVSWLIESRR